MADFFTRKVDNMLSSDKWYWTVLALGCLLPLIFVPEKRSCVIGLVCGMGSSVLFFFGCWDSYEQERDDEPTLWYLTVIGLAFFFVVTVVIPLIEWWAFATGFLCGMGSLVLIFLIPSWWFGRKAMH